MTQVSEYEVTPTTDPVTGNVDYSHLSTDQVEQIEDLFSQLPILFKESKAGYKTTEFWLTVLTMVLLNVNLIPLPDSWQGIASAALVVVYAISRGLAKRGVPDAELVKTADQAA